MMWSGWLRGKISCYFPTCLLIFAYIKELVDDNPEIEQDERLRSLRALESSTNDEPENEELSLWGKVRLYFKLLILIVLPVFSYFFLKKNRAKFNDEKFELSYGTLYQNLNPKKDSTLIYISIFCLRRVVIALCTVFINDYHIVNIFINIFLSLAMLKFLIEKQPMEYRFLNFLEISNEMFMLFFYYFMFIFTTWIPDAEARYKGGKIFMSYMIFIVGINIIVIIFDIIP